MIHQNLTIINTQEFKVSFWWGHIYCLNLTDKFFTTQNVSVQVHHLYLALNDTRWHHVLIFLRVCCSNESKSSLGSSRATSLSAHSSFTAVQPSTIYSRTTTIKHHSSESFCASNIKYPIIRMSLVPSLEAARATACYIGFPMTACRQEQRRSVEWEIIIKE